MKNYKKDFYDSYDAVRLFLYVLLIPYLAMFLLVGVYMIIGTSMNVSMDDFMSYLPVILINAVFMQICLVVIYFVFNYKRGINFVNATQFNKKVNAWAIAIALCMGFAFMWFSSPLVTLFEQGLIGLGFNLSSDLGFSLDNAGTIIFAIIGLGIVPAFIEEFIFRGAILQGLRKYGNWFAIIVSALLFMLLHSNIQQTIYQFAFGILAGWLVIKTGSIWTSILMHAFNNVTIIIMQSIYEIKGINTTEVVVNSELIIQAIIYTIILVALIWLGVYLINKVYKNKAENETLVSQTDNEKTKQNNVDYSKIGFKQGCKIFAQDSVMKREGILAIFIALILLIINSTSMLM